MKIKLITKTPDIINVLYTAMRTCYSKLSPIEIWESINEVDEEKKLDRIKSCIKSGHHSTLEHISFVFAIEGIDRATSHQLVRHRTGISFSQKSQRYVNHKDLKTVTPQAIEKSSTLKYCFNEALTKIQETYNYLIKHGIKAEDSRAILPNCTCTDMIMTVNLRELIHLCNLRLCTRAQLPIRQMFQEIKNIVVEQEPWLKNYLVPTCEIHGFCTEEQCCGRKPTIDELKDNKHE